MYLLISEINRKALGQENSNKLAFKRIMDFYEYNNGNRPI